ncbi:hypothetical protein [Tunicatimonas pelagia]|uniref:hypothetical protein n=1 Tax=Tunicatimonas pelagia TaxID=931531 RepID=UPI0026654A5E|nr:hypothetical protein [Tunicatimonas pelagia]WKN42342.1 hypothetical protein P0M28_25230 [Tunicatimonas pelagia]
MKKLTNLTLGIGILFFSFTAQSGFAQDFCTCNLERETEWDSDTLIYSAALTVFSESSVRELYFAIAQDEDQTYYIQSNVSPKLYIFSKADRSVSDQWGEFGRAVSLRKAILEIIGEDMFRTQCQGVYLDKRTYDFSSVLTYLAPTDKKE